MAGYVVPPVGGVGAVSGGQYRGAVASVTSGKESISYAVSGNAATVYADAAANPAALTELLCGIAAKYLSNVPDANGVNLLYAGV